MKGPLFTGLLAITNLYLHAVEISNREGIFIEVEILVIDVTRIQIQMANGQTTWLDRTRLSEESQKMIKDKETREQNAHEALNALLGINLFTDSSLWNDPSTSVAERLGWPQESKTDLQSSFRYYPHANYRILQARPYSAVLYGEDGKVRHVNIVFANKGDFKFTDSPGAGEIGDMERAIEQDFGQIRNLLSEQLGEPDRQQFGAGRGIKQLIDRWDWKSHAFLLASRDGEYTNLKIMHSSAADNKGRGKKYPTPSCVD